MAVRGAFAGRMRQPLNTAVIFVPHSFAYNSYCMRRGVLTVKKDALRADGTEFTVGYVRLNKPKEFSVIT